MCIFCGTPDPSHDTMILRTVVLASGTGFILTPRRWLAQLRTAVVRKVRTVRTVGQRRPTVDLGLSVAPRARHSHAAAKGRDEDGGWQLWIRRDDEYGGRERLCSRVVRLERLTLFDADRGERINHGSVTL